MNHNKKSEFNSPSYGEIASLIEKRRVVGMRMTRVELALKSGIQANTMSQAFTRMDKDTNPTLTLDILKCLEQPLAFSLHARSAATGQVWTIDLDHPVGDEILRVVYKHRFDKNGKAIEADENTTNDLTMLSELSRTAAYRYLLISAREWNEALQRGQAPRPKQKILHLKDLIGLLQDYHFEWGLVFDPLPLRFDELQIPPKYLLPDDKVLVAAINRYPNLMLTINDRLYHAPLTSRASGDAEKVRIEQIRHASPRYALLYFTEPLYLETKTAEAGMRYCVMLCELGDLDERTDHAPTDAREAAEFLKSQYQYATHHSEYRLYHIRGICQHWGGDEGLRIIHAIDLKYKPKIIGAAALSAIIPDFPLSLAQVADAK